MKKIYVLLFPVLAASCATHVKYLGASYKPTTQVDVFVDKASIKRGYDIMGKGYEASAFIAPNITAVQKKAVKVAKNKGADAVFFEEYFVVDKGLAINTVSTADSVGKGIVAVSNTTVNPTSSTGYKIYFLKYK